MTKQTGRDTASRVAIRNLLSKVAKPTAQVLETFNKATLAKCTIVPTSKDDEDLSDSKIVVKNGKETGVILLVVASELYVETIAFVTNELPSLFGKNLKTKTALDGHIIYINSSSRPQQLVA